MRKPGTEERAMKKEVKKVIRKNTKFVEITFDISKSILLYDLKEK